MYVFMIDEPFGFCRLLASLQIIPTGIGLLNCMKKLPGACDLWFVKACQERINPSRRLPLSCLVWWTKTGLTNDMHVKLNIASDPNCFIGIVIWFMHLNHLYHSQEPSMVFFFPVPSLSEVGEIVSLPNVLEYWCYFLVRSASIRTN